MRNENGLMNRQRDLSVDRQHMEQFKNYELVRRIAVGGMGEVYLARQRTAFGREVAVKIIRADLMHDVVARKRFLREAEVGAYLKHDHILSMLEFGEEQGRLFIVTPYVKGGTLAQRLERGALSLAEVHELFSSLVQAVAYLHKRDVIHRDLKPSNILLDREDDANGRVRVRLIDFGIASMKGSQMSAPLTTAGEEMGTESFMAPERLEGSVSPSNDIYSLGVILYLMLTGHLPEEQDPQPLPQPLERVIARATAHDPDDRFADADELLQAFEAAYRSLTSPRQHSPAPVTPGEPGPAKTAAPLSPMFPMSPSQPAAPETPRLLRDVAQERTIIPPSEKYAQRRALAEQASGQHPAVNGQRPLASASDPALPSADQLPARLQRGRGAESSGRIPAVSHTSEVDSSGRLPTLPDRTGRSSGRIPAVSNKNTGSSGRIPVVPGRPTSSSAGRIPALSGRPPAGSGSAGRIPVVPPVEQKKEQTGAADTPAQQGELKLPPLPGKTGSFSKADYNAPTAYLAQKEKEVEERQLADVGVVTGTPAPTAAQPRRRVRRSLVALIVVLVLALLLGISGVGYLIFVATISADIRVTPRVQSINGVFTITARPSIKELDSNASAIPASVLTSTQSGTQQGTATGISGCVMQFYECKQTVSYADVDNTANKIIPGLKNRIAQDLRSQVSAAGGTMVGNIVYPEPTVNADPQPRTISPTVNVTVSQQGGVEYVKTNDVRTLAGQLLKHKLPQNYDLVDSSMQIGQPVIRGVDQKGNVTIAIAAAGVSKYNVSDNELSDIRNHIKGKPKQEARAIIAKDQNLDPQSISVRISYGENIPTNPNQIRLLSDGPVNLPPVRLPPVPNS